MTVIGRQGHDFIEIAFEAAATALSRCLGEFMTPPGQHNHPEQPCLHARGKNHVPGLDGKLAVS
jgi:hypothetical protein